MSALAPWAVAYLGRAITYVDKGRVFTGPRLGLDCYGFAMLVHREQFGRDIRSHADKYESATDSGSVSAAIEQHREEQFRRLGPDEAPEVGDLVTVQRMNLPLHVGVYVGADHILQLSREGVTLVSIRPGSTTGRRVEGIFRCV